MGSWIMWNQLLYLLFYSGLFASIGVIYRENGVTGFFSGLVPRVLCELGALWVGNMLVHIINNYIVEDKDLKTYVGASMRVRIIIWLWNYVYKWILCINCYSSNHLDSKTIFIYDWCFI